jgi:hypothetical protein
MVRFYFHKKNPLIFVLVLSIYLVIVYNFDIILSWTQNREKLLDEKFNSMIKYSINKETIEQCRLDYYKNLEEQNMVAQSYIEKELTEYRHIFKECEDEKYYKEESIFINDFDFDSKSKNIKFINTQFDNNSNEHDYIRREIENKNFINSSDNVKQFFQIKLNKKFLDVYLKSTPKYHCYIQYFNRILDKPDRMKNVETIGNQIDFTVDNHYQIITDTFGFIHIKCEESDYDDEVVYENVYTILPRQMSNFKFTRNNFNENGETVANMNEIDDKKYKNVTKLDNVLILALDSMSNANFQRVFPLTYTFLNKQLTGAVSFKRYITVGDNTKPNFVPLLTGYAVEEHEELVESMDRIKQLKQLIDNKYYDNVPFIWDEYEKLNYITMHQEELAKWGLFNNDGNGFR